MASSMPKGTAYAELTRKQLPSPAFMVIEPPMSGFMRVHLSLNDIPAHALAFDIDIVPSLSEAGSVKVRV